MKKPENLRSARWFEAGDFRSFNHRSRMMQNGYAISEWQGRPIIGIMNTWSDLNACHGHFRARVEDIKRGVLMAGGFPVEIPVMTLYETLVKPSAMLYRNLMAMEIEEVARCNPIDGIVLMGGCDKTTPGLLLGATSVGLPTIFIPAGPMLRGNCKGMSLGSGSDAFKYWDEYRAGNMTREELDGICDGIARSYGSCMTMGTASSMAAIVEALGMCLPGSASIPAVDANHQRMCSEAGRRIVDMVWNEITPDKIQTREAFLNAITVAMSVGCSTNTIIHVIAQARRAGIDISLDDFETASREVPVIANIRPNGTSQFLMEDFHYAGGVRGLMSRLTPWLHLEALTVSGKSVEENLHGAQVYNDDVIRTVENAIYKEGGLAILKGNLAPDGCVMKVSACNPKFLKHTGPAVVFDDYPSFKAVVDREDFDVTEDSVLILRNAGPQGGPGMPEWGMLPIPKKLMKQGVRDMLRISDARMSGTSYGACVLHVSPEAYIGGPLALVQNGDLISVDVHARTITLNVSDEELQIRKTKWEKPSPRFGRGFGWMYAQHVQQAHLGCDFDFLESSFGPSIGEPDIF